MSAFSLDKLTRHKYIQEFEDNILYNFDNYFYHKNFRVGGGIKDEKELKHNIIFYKLLNIDVCQNIDYIKAHLEGYDIAEPKRKKHDLATLLKKFEKYKEDNNFQNIHDNVPYVWSKVEW